MFFIKYKYKNYLILKANGKNTFIVYNKNKQFLEGHTHVKYYRIAKKLVHWSYDNKIPEHAKQKTLISLIRISKNKNYIQQLNNEIDKKKGGNINVL